MTITTDDLIALKARNLSWKEIATQTGMTWQAARGRVRRAQGNVIVDDLSSGLFNIIRNRGLDVPALPMLPMINTDSLIVTGDWHVPTSDWQFLGSMCEFALRNMRKGQRRMALVGDLFNFDGLSGYEHTSIPSTISQEIAAAETVIDYVMTVFDEIYFAVGNHDQRFTKFLSGSFGVERLARLFTRNIQTGRFKATDLRQMETVNGGIHYRLTHQRNYSRNKGIVASQLCLKYQTNVITHHQHHVGLGRDVFNRYTWIDNGMMADYRKMDYVMNSDSTSPVMCTGFTFLRNGTAHLLTPYATITDWDMWKMGNVIRLQEQVA